MFKTLGRICLVVGIIGLLGLLFSLISIIYVYFSTNISNDFIHNTTNALPKAALIWFVLGFVGHYLWNKNAKQKISSAEK